MTESDRPAFAALLADVLGFYRQSASPFALSVWWEACKGFDIAALRKAMTMHATDPERGHFAPMPADVIRHLRGGSAEAAHTAWTALLEQVRAVGSYGSPKVDEPTRRAMQALGGWGAICRAQESDLPFLQRRFCEAFGVETERAQRAEFSLESAADNLLRLQ